MKEKGSRIQHNETIDYLADMSFSYMLLLIVNLDSVGVPSVPLDAANGFTVYLFIYFNKKMLQFDQK